MNMSGMRDTKTSINSNSIIINTSCLEDNLSSYKVASSDNCSTGSTGNHYSRHLALNIPSDEDALDWVVRRENGTLFTDRNSYFCLV